MKKIKWSKKEDNYLRKVYGTQNSQKISKTLKRTQYAILHRCSKLGLKGYNSGYFKRCELNDNVFAIINNKSCYFAGLMGSDGCIQNDKMASFTQCQRNIIYINKLKNYIEYSGKLLGPYNKIYPSFTLSFTSPKIVNDLKDNFNITTKKSLTLKSPSKLKKLENKLSYILGYIDGDGCVGAYKYDHLQNLYIKIHICGTKNLLEWIKSTIDKSLNIVTGNVTLIKNHTYQYQLTGTKAEKFIILCRSLNIIKDYSKINNVKVRSNNKWFKSRSK